MARSKKRFVCNNCGHITSKWVGQCESCGAWNTLEEEATGTGVGAGPKTQFTAGDPIELVGLTGPTLSATRLVTRIGEFDMVTGGGFVKGSACLIGGEPGIGKSTLLLQACASLAQSGAKVIYISGEEAIAQVRLRAQRLGLEQAHVLLGAETCLENILATVEKQGTPDLVIIDSIQTLWTQKVESAPGTVTQVRTCAQALIQFAKARDTAMLIVGHVTKDGQIAGPRVVEHMVDAVLYFEGDQGHHYRLLRAVKNRFGAVDEIGVFEMTAKGLTEVPNPSALFLSQRDEAAPGTAVFASMEGTRPLLMEVQSLVAPSPLGNPRRAVVGWEQNRLSMLLAVLEAHCGVKLGTMDVFVNFAGGLKVKGPGADIAVAASLLSSMTGTPLPQGQIYFGEVGLSGAIRPVPQAPSRRKEAQKLGFKMSVGPKQSGLETKAMPHQAHSALSSLTATLLEQAAQQTRKQEK